ncbi:aminomethyltransferase [Amylibacter marinus]|uniref:Aminomethyltransferase n=1 Tax=Amylibacter marinus TaxID=1475483 RepID=A0ABQ5VYF4_9RHOB|nr:aminomethyltransferase family protein [Amylibacter marinus]GLQ36116.1 aminomethyltransferase [Amylibacter marinus]
MQQLIPPRIRGLKTSDIYVKEAQCGEAQRLDLLAGSILSITNVEGGSAAYITALSAGDVNFSPDVFHADGVPLPRHSLGSFDEREMIALTSARGGQISDASFAPLFDATSEVGALHVTSLPCNCTVFVIAPVARDYLSQGGGGRFSIHIQPPAGHRLDQDLPPPLGHVRDEWRVKRATALSYELTKGQFVQIIDVEGQQCSDFMAMRSSALDAGVERYIDSTVSRTMARAAYPLPGLHDKFYDQDMRALLSVRQDTVGRHDTFALACTARGYEDRGFPGHINCSDNISEAFEPYGIKRRAAWPAINFFFNSWMDPDHGHLASDEAWSRPGDYVALEAKTDLVCVSTACPDDVDPINGWNPTDIHIRIYEEDSSITHSVAWRANPEDSAKMTRHSAFHPRTSQLTSSFTVARDLWTPTHFDTTGAIEEYWACKNAATLQDMSGLRKFDIIGPDAARLLQHCLTRNVDKLAQHRGFYALMCDERGSVLDDGTLFCIEPTTYRWCCGSDNSALHLREMAQELGLNVHIRALGHRMVNLAIQGPKSRDILRKLTYSNPARPALDNIKWFGFTIARLGDVDGPSFMLCRTGFTGELGYEIFCDRNDATAIWDAVIDAGQPEGLVPMGGEALEMLRLEAGLMISGAEFGPDIDALESGLGFAVDFAKEAFVGRAALMRNAAGVRRKLVGIKLTGAEAPAHGDPVYLGREQVGMVTSASYSPQLGHAIAMARVAIEQSEENQELEIGRLDGHMKRHLGTVCALPFLDPTRKKARA